MTCRGLYSAYKNLKVFATVINRKQKLYYKTLQAAWTAFIDALPSLRPKKYPSLKRQY